MDEAVIRIVVKDEDAGQPASAPISTLVNQPNQPQPAPAKPQAIAPPIEANKPTPIQPVQVVEQDQQRPIPVEIEESETFGEEDEIPDLPPPAVREEQEPPEKPPTAVVQPPKQPQVTQQPASVQQTPETVYVEYQQAMEALGHPKKEAEQKTKELRQSGKVYATVEYAILDKPEEPAPMLANQAGAAQQPNQVARPAVGNQPAQMMQNQQRQQPANPQSSQQQLQLGVNQSVPAFDPNAEAKKRREGEERQKQVNAAYEKMYPTQADVFDAEAEARKQIDGENRRKAVRAAYDKLNPPEPTPAFDPNAEAQKRLDSENRKKQVDEAYEKLNPTPKKEEEVFDPRKEAEKHHDAEVRNEQIKQAYEEMYGATEKTKSAFDLTLDVAQKMRGTIGGVFGILVGATLDAVSMYRDYQQAQQDDAKKQQIREEARQKNAQAVAVPTPQIRKDEDKPAAAQPVQQPAKAPVTMLAPPIANQPSQNQPVQTQPPIVANKPEEEEPAQAVPVVQQQPQQPQKPVQQPPMMQPEEPDKSIVQPVLVVNPQPIPVTMAGGAPPKDQEQPKTTVNPPAAQAPSIAAPPTPSNAPPAPPKVTNQPPPAPAGAGPAIQGAEAASSAVSGLAVAAGIASVALIAAGAVFNQVTAALDKRVETYAQYSPDVAIAQSMAEVRNVLGDLRRAQQFGPELAKYIQQKNELDQQWEQTKVELLMKIQPAIVGIMALLQPIAAAIGGVGEVLGAVLSPIAAIKTLLGRINGNMERPEERELDPTTIILNEWAQNNVPRGPRAGGA